MYWFINFAHQDQWKMQCQEPPTTVQIANIHEALQHAAEQVKNKSLSFKCKHNQQTLTRCARNLRDACNKKMANELITHPMWQRALGSNKMAK